MYSGVLKGYEVPAPLVEREMEESDDLIIGILSSVASLLTSILYQGNLNVNHKVRNSISTERYVYNLYVCSTGMLLHINIKFILEKLESSSLLYSVVINHSRSPFLGVG